MTLHNDLIWGELSISKTGELDIRVNRLDTVLASKVYAEDELKIQQKSTEISREYPFLARVTVSWMFLIKYSHFRVFLSIYI